MTSLFGSKTGSDMYGYYGNTYGGTGYSVIVNYTPEGEIDIECLESNSASGSTKSTNEQSSSLVSTSVFAASTKSIKQEDVSSSIKSLTSLSTEKNESTIKIETEITTHISSKVQPQEDVIVSSISIGD